MEEKEALGRLRWYSVITWPYPSSKVSVRSTKPFTAMVSATRWCSGNRQAGFLMLQLPHSLWGVMASCWPAKPCFPSDAFRLSIAIPAIVQPASPRRASERASWTRKTSLPDYSVSQVIEEEILRVCHSAGVAHPALMDSRHIEISDGQLGTRTLEGLVFRRQSTVSTQNSKK